MSSTALSSSYGCNIKNLVVSSRDTEIVEVSGSHKSGHSDSDVHTLFAFNSVSPYMPKTLGFVFPNLKTILMTKTSLHMIEFRDFKNLKKLQRLYLPENQIEKVSFCTFRYADNIEVIDLSGNRIIELPEDVFANLHNLHQFIANDNHIAHIEAGLFRGNPNLRKVSLHTNNISVVEVNFMKIEDIELVDLRFNSCVNLSFGCCKGPALREFHVQMSESCAGQKSDEN